MLLDILYLDSVKCQYFWSASRPFAARPWPDDVPGHAGNLRVVASAGSPGTAVGTLPDSTHETTVTPARYSNQHFQLGRLQWRSQAVLHFTPFAWLNVNIYILATLNVHGSSARCTIGVEYCRTAALSPWTLSGDTIDLMRPCRRKIGVCQPAPGWKE